MTNRVIDIGVLVGKTLVTVNAKEGAKSVEFLTTCGKRYVWWHSRDCCESVVVATINGSLDNLIGSPVTRAELTTLPEDNLPNETEPDSFTWTNGVIETAKGKVVIRWYGSSNGYYCETPEFMEQP
jgi:hypothetical protein